MFWLGFGIGCVVGVFVAFGILASVMKVID